MDVSLYTDPSAFDALAAEWEDLMTRAVVAPLFMTVGYQKIWWSHLGTGDLKILAVHDEQQRLVGLAPLFEVEQQLRTVGCVDVSDYLDFLVDRDSCAEVYETLFRYLADHLPGWTSAYFCSLPHHSPTREMLLDLAEKEGWSAESDVEEVCPVITLAESWDGYLSMLNKKQRHEIRRKLRRAEGTAVTHWHVIETPDDLSDDKMAVFIDLHQKSNVEKEDFWDDQLINFFKALVTYAAEVGWLKLYFVEIDGELASALLCFDYQNEILVYNSGFDPDKFGHLSPGNIIVSYSIQHAISLGRKRYDFLRGDEVYKFRFGAVAEDVLNVKLQRGTV